MSGTVLVTGASGFAGSHLVQLLASRGAVTAWTRSSPPEGLVDLANWRQVDLLDRQNVIHEIATLQPTQIYHCAGSPHVAESWRDATTPLSENILTTHHLLEALGRVGKPARLMVPGSATVYAPATTPLTETDTLQPASPYAVAKLAQEQLCLRAIAEDGVDVVLTRSFNHIGPRQRPDFAAASFAREIASIEHGLSAPIIHVGNLDAERDFTDVRDMVAAYVAVMDTGKAGEIYNVASGIARPIRSILDGLLALARVPVRIETDPARMRPHDTPVIVGDSSKLRAATGWTPRITFDAMLADLLDYWRKIMG